LSRVDAASVNRDAAYSDLACVVVSAAPFLRSMSLTGQVRPNEYPFDLPAVRALDDIEFGAVTVLVGNNGSGKSTVVEALSVACGFNAEGGSRNLRFETHGTHSELARHVDLRWRRQAQWGWFLRAETFYGMATQIATDRELAASFPDLHSASHGESFISLMASRFGSPGLYIMDEPESALSFHGQLQLLRLIHDATREGSQFVIATHSPMLMRVPDATIYLLNDDGLTRAQYDDLEVVQLWRRFMIQPESILGHLLSDDD
jgi:predicted ATPase